LVKLNRLIKQKHYKILNFKFRIWKEIFNLSKEMENMNQMQLLQESKQQNIFTGLTSLVLAQMPTVFSDNDGNPKLFRSVEECFESS